MRIDRREYEPNPAQNIEKRYHHGRLLCLLPSTSISSIREFIRELLSSPTQRHTTNLITILHRCDSLSFHCTILLQIKASLGSSALLPSPLHTIDHDSPVSTAVAPRSRSIGADFSRTNVHKVQPAFTNMPSRPRARRIYQRRSHIRSIEPIQRERQPATLVRQQRREPCRSAVRQLTDPDI